MKKRMIPAGALFLAMACGNGNSRSEDRAQAKRIVNMEVSAPEPTSAAEEPIPPEADEAREDGDNAFIYQANTNGAFAINMSAGTASYSVLDASTDQWKASETAKPNVGKAISSSAAVQGTDTMHHFIRTADIRFRVKDVVKATLGIEDIVGAHHGWITRTQLRSEPRGESIIPVSEDSLLEVSRYELVNTITLRVPNTELDSAIRQIGRWVDLFDHRDILADDIRLRMMANAMAVRRAKAHSIRVTNAIDDQGRKLKETLAAEEALQASDEKRDQGILNNLDLADRVAFSTVTIDIHQRTLVRKEMIANERSIEGYQPSLWSRICDALANGWRLVEIMITGLVSIWPVVLLLGGSLWLLWRKRGKRKVTTHVPMVVPPAPPVDPPSQAAADN